MSKHTDAPPVSGGQYFRTKDMMSGKPYRVRILSEPIIGYLGWKDGKPIRRPFVEGKSGNDHFKPGEVLVDDKSKIRYFRAFFIWDYQDHAVKVWELTQGTIIAAIRQHVSDPDFGGPEGDATAFDLKVSKTGSGMDTEYTVSPAPPSPIIPEIVDAWDAVNRKGCDLTALFNGGDPFDAIPF